MTLDVDKKLDDDGSEEGEETGNDDKDAEETDPGWEDEGRTRDKFGLIEYSEKFMRQVIDYVDGNNKSSKRRRSWKSIHNRFKNLPNQIYIGRFRR